MLGDTGWTVLTFIGRGDTGWVDLDWADDTGYRWAVLTLIGRMILGGWAVLTLIRWVILGGWAVLTLIGRVILGRWAVLTLIGRVILGGWAVLTLIGRSHSGCLLRNMSSASTQTRKLSASTNDTQLIRRKMSPIHKRRIDTKPWNTRKIRQNKTLKAYVKLMQYETQILLRNIFNIKKIPKKTNPKILTYFLSPVSMIPIGNSWYKAESASTEQSFLT